MKSLLGIRFTGLRRTPLIALSWCGALACGVVEHPHETQAIDTSNDFGPPSGVVTPTAGTGSGVAGSVSTGGSGVVGVGGSSATGGTGVVAQAGGGVAPTSGSAGVSTGGATVGGGGAASGVTINLGGVDVPKEKAIAFIHIGHSNMAGRATGPTASRPYHFTETNPHAYMYHVGSAPALAIEPKTAGDTAAGGPGTALMKEAVAMAPDYYFISLGFGQPSAYCSQFIPGGLYYDKLIAAPKAIKGRVTFGGIFIYLGITERHGTAADRTGFAQCINTLVTAIRNDVGEPNLPALMNDYEVEGSGEFVVGGDVYNAIKPQIDMCPTVVSNFALVSAAGLGMQDDHHFNLDGHRTWVQRALMTMKTKGWFPWGN